MTSRREFLTIATAGIFVPKFERWYKQVFSKKYELFNGLYIPDAQLPLGQDWVSRVTNEKYPDDYFVGTVVELNGEIRTVIASEGNLVRVNHPFSTKFSSGHFTIL